MSIPICAGDFKLTETGALVRYFGRKADLCGATQDDAAKIDMISDVAQDIKMAMIKICFSPEFVSYSDMFLCIYLLTFLLIFM